MPSNGYDQDGINMVDLMMWLVIAALLLAAAIQGIGYYQKAAYIYQMKSDLVGAGQNITSRLANADTNGAITKPIVDDGVANTSWTANIGHSVEQDPASGKYFIRATSPGVSDVDVVYLFDSCGATLQNGTNMVPKGSVPDLSTCTVPAASASSSPSASASASASPSSTATSASTKCTGLSTSAEASCWMDQFTTAETGYEATNNHYFGAAQYSNDTNYPYAAPELAGAPLQMNSVQDVYRDTSTPPDPSWDANSVDMYVVDRGGEIWTKNLYDSFNQPNGLSVGTVNDTGANSNYNCEFVTPADLDNTCANAGIPVDKYRTPTTSYATGDDSTAIADVNKVINAQFAYATANGGELYGGYGQTVNVQSWAGTTYPAKVWNTDTTATDIHNAYTRVMVTAPNGDLYTAQWADYKSAPNNTNPVFIYRYSSDFVNRVCTRPFANIYNQQSDVQTCSSFGYTNFHP